MFEETEEKPRRGRPPRETTKKVLLKKVVFINGELIGNPGAVIDVDLQIFNQLMKSGVIDEIPE